MLKHLLAVAGLATAPLFYAQLSYAQVDVVESTPVGTPAAVPLAEAPAPTAPTNPQAEMFYQMQMLQQEVQELRGLVEEQAYELKRLKQQRLDDYLDLDRRLSGLSGAKAPQASDRQPAASGDAAPAGKPVAALEGDAQSYRTAYDLLKNDLEAARQSFTTLLDGFADHRKVPDAKFKLGKVYDLMGDKEKARALLEEVAASNADASRLAKNYLQANFQ